MENTVIVLDVKETPWQSVLACARSECNDFGMAILDAVGYEGFFDGYAHLTVPDKFRETWLNSHYGDLLRTSFAKVLGSSFIDYRIRLLAPSEPIPEIKLSNNVPPISSRKVREVVKKVRPRPALYSRYTFENFIEGECNSTALRACMAVVENPGDMGMNPLLIYGESGLGKTHLLQAIAQELYVSRPELKIEYRQAYDFLRDSAAIGDAVLAGKAALAEELKQRFIERYAECDVLLIDDIQLLKKGVKTQERLALLIKTLRNDGRQVVLSCDRHPSSFKPLPAGARPAADSSIPQLSVNLLSHLENCVAVGLAEPDIETRMNLIREKSREIPFVSRDREEICRFLAIQPKSNVRLIEGSLNWLRAMHSLNGVELDFCCVRQLLSSSNAENNNTLSVKNIAEAVAASFGVEPLVLSSKRQDAKASLPRKVAMFLCREMTAESLQSIGAWFNRDYATVIAAIQSLVAQMGKDDSLSRRVKDVRYILES